jgi:hypothetical protein
MTITVAEPGTWHLRPIWRDTIRAEAIAMTDILNGLVELISLLFAAGEVPKPNKCLWRRVRRQPAKMPQG